MMGLYKFFWDCGRYGSLTGLFEATAEDVNGILGKTVYLGDVLGKHSDVQGDIKDGDIELLTEDEEFIERAKELGLVPIGIDPLDYYHPEDE